MSSPRLVLASTSPYRRELLSRLGVPFDVQSPGVDETPHPGEPPVEIATRLAIAKARAVRIAEPAVIIGSDQVAMLDGRMLGKPGNRETAVHQLTAASGRTVEFHTALCVRSTVDERESVALDTTRVTFRPLNRDTIERYVDIEKPFDCAGSAKSEGLGITLVTAIETTDPTGLVGLPLILLTDLLAQHGIRVP